MIQANYLGSDISLDLIEVFFHFCSDLVVKDRVPATSALMLFLFHSSGALTACCLAALSRSMYQVPEIHRELYNKVKEQRAT